MTAAQPLVSLVSLNFSRLSVEQQQQCSESIASAPFSHTLLDDLIILTLNVNVCYLH